MTQFWNMEAEMSRHWRRCVASHWLGTELVTHAQPRRQLMFFVAVVVFGTMEAVWVVCAWKLGVLSPDIWPLGEPTET